MKTLKPVLLPLTLAVFALSACSFDVGTAEPVDTEEEAATSEAAESTVDESQPATEEPQTPEDGEQVVTAAATAIADAASDALESTYGQRPAIDCGTVDIQLYEDRKVYCDLTDPGSGEIYAATMTITGFDGDQWNFDIEVDPEPK